jgi:hypothetical protein
MGTIWVLPAPNGGWPFLELCKPQRPAKEPLGWEGRRIGSAQTPHPAFFLLNPIAHPPPCMMGKAILPLPPAPASAACLGEGAVRWGQRLRTPLLADLHTLATSDTLCWASPSPHHPCPAGRVIMAWNSLGQEVLDPSWTPGHHLTPPTPASSGWTWGPLPVMHFCPGPTPPSLTSLGLWPLRKGPILPRLSLQK